MIKGSHVSVIKIILCRYASKLNRHDEKDDCF